MEKVFYFLGFTLLYLIIKSTTRLGFGFLLIVTSFIQIVSYAFKLEYFHSNLPAVHVVIEHLSIASLLAVLFASIMRTSSEYRDKIDGPNEEI